MKTIYWRFYIKIPLTFWDMGTCDMRAICEKIVYKHSEKIYVES